MRIFCGQRRDNRRKPVVAGKALDRDAQDLALTRARKLEACL